MDPFSANYALASAAALHPLLGPTALYLDYHPLRQLQRKIPPPPPPDQLPASPSSLSSSLSTCSDNSKKMVKDSSSGEEAAAKRLKSQTASLPDDNIGQQTANVECVVCGDKSSGKHYGQLTCEGCKSFFKRSVRRNVQYVCRNNNDCPVDLNHRNQCQHCRLRKCYEAGMRREAVQRGRVPLSFQPFHHNGQDLYKLPAVASSAVHQRKDCSPKPSKASVEAFPDFITQLLTAEPYSPSLGSGFVLSNVENGLLGIDQLGELSARILFTTIEWARNLHIFNALKLTDQIILLCSSWSELFLLNMAQCNVILHAASFLAATNFYSPPAPNIMTGGDRVLHLMDQICKFQGKVEKLRSLKLDAAEYACLKALALFSSDAFGLTDVCKIENLQEMAQTNLEEYCNSKNLPTINNDEKSSSSRFGKLLLRLPSLRAIGSQTIEQLFFVRTVGKMPVETVIKDILLSSSNSSCNNDSKNLESKIFSPPPAARHHHQNIFNNGLPPVGPWIH